MEWSMLMGAWLAGWNTKQAHCILQHFITGPMERKEKREREESRHAQETEILYPLPYSVLFLQNQGIFTALFITATIMAERN